MRKDWIDIARGLAMILVIAGHFMIDYGNYCVLLFITAFHMPLFFLINGFTSKVSSNAKEYIQFVKKRFFLLYLPYLVLAMILCRPEASSLPLVLYGSNRALHNSGGNGALWFLPCLFLADLLWGAFSLLIYKYAQRRIIICICYVIFGGIALFLSFVLSLVEPEIGYPFTFDGALAGFFFIAVGHLWVKYIDNYDKKLYLILGFIVCVIITIVLIPYNLIETEGAVFGPQMAISSYGIYPLFLLEGLFGSMGMVFLAKLLKKNRLFQYVGRNTLLILGVHQIVIMGVESLFLKINIKPNMAWYIVAIIIVTALSTVVSDIIIRIFLGQIKWIKCYNKN